MSPKNLTHSQGLVAHDPPPPATSCSRVGEGGKIEHWPKSHQDKSSLHTTSLTIMVNPKPYK